MPGGNETPLRSPHSAKHQNDKKGEYQKQYIQLIQLLCFYDIFARVRQAEKVGIRIPDF